MGRLGGMIASGYGDSKNGYYEQTKQAYQTGRMYTLIL